MKTQEELYRDHGTPAEFAAAVRLACDQFYITPDEADAAIFKYKVQWAESAKHGAVRVKLGLITAESPKEG